MSYIYQADIYCDDCGKDIRRRLKEDSKKNNQKLETETSDEYPQSDIGWSTEADSPQHCGSHSDCLNALELSDGTKVGCFLENDLTQDGEAYVKEQHRNSPGEITEMWMNFYGLSVEDILPQEDDWVTEDYKEWWQYRNSIDPLFITDPDNWTKQLKEQMDKDQYWPDCWYFGERGDWNLLDIDTAIFLEG